MCTERLSIGFGAVKLQYLAQPGPELIGGIKTGHRRAESRRRFPLREQTSGQLEQPLDPAPTELFNIAVFDVNADGKNKNKVSGMNGTYLSGFITDVGRVRHVVCAVTRRMCHRALRKKRQVLLRNAWRVTQTTLTRPTFRLK